MADTFAMVARFTGFVFRNNRSGQGRCLLLALVILLLIGLLGHFALEAAGISSDALEMPDLHTNVLMVVPLLFVYPFLQIVPVLHSGPSLSVWFPELAPRPPVSLLSLALFFPFTIQSGMTTLSCRCYGVTMQ